MDKVLSHFRLPRAGDLDLQFAQAAPKLINDNWGADLKNLRVSLRILDNVRRLDPDGGMFMLRDVGKGQFRYCPACLKQQQIAHVPIHWRVSVCRVCPVHHCLMETGCPHCESPTVLPYSMIDAGPQRQGLASLSRCKQCGKSLAAVKPCHPSTKGQGAVSMSHHWVLQNGTATLAALYFGYVLLGNEQKRQGLQSLLTLYRNGLLPRDQMWLDPRIVRARAASQSTRSASESLGESPDNSYIGINF